MSDRNKYNTRQKNDIIECLKAAKGTQMTVSDLNYRLHGQGVNIGMTTIYRHLEKLLEDGVVNKYTADGDRSAYFEYIGKEDCHKPRCFHCKCVKCGKLIHLDCGELSGVVKHLEESHGFTVDPVKTVFYGLCRTCREVA